MARTLHQHHPEAALTVLLLDADPDSVDAISGARMLGLDSVVGAEHGQLVGANAPGALAIAVLPYLVRAVFTSGATSVLYIGSGQRILGPVAELCSLLGDCQLVQVARTRPQSPQMGSFAAEPTQGAFSRELLGFRAGASSDALLAVWPGYFAIQDDEGSSAVHHWLSGIAARVDGVAVLHDPGYGLDPWTLATWTSAGGVTDVDGALCVGGRPARVLDFSDLDPEDAPAWFGGDGRVRLGELPALGVLIERQVEDLLAADWVGDVARPVTNARFDDGLRLTDTIRMLLASAIAEGHVTVSPFMAQGRAEFYEYLNQPGDRGTAAGLTRLHMAIWWARRDLQAGYPHLDGPDGVGFAGWLSVHGGNEEGLAPELLPPTPELAYRDANPHVHEGEPPWGVNVVGFLTAELGVGEAARLLIAGLDAQGIPALPIQGHFLPPSREQTEYDYARPDEAAYPVNILCINGDGVPVFAREAGRSFFEGRYTIALWWWEAGEPPASWAPAYEFVDEVWVASQHVYDALAPCSPVPVVRMRLPITAPEVPARTRVELGLPTEGFIFLSVFDYHSVAPRKNPVAVIDAFRRAFPPGSNAKLVLKSMNAHAYPAEHARVLLAAGDRDDILLLEEYVTSGEKNALIAACDCYVSLHRSEGLGISVAEAMLLGKPVIATRYGGTLEFMNDENSFLVDWEPTAVGEDAYPYAADAVWAEPDVEHASALMRGVFASPDDARARGEIARRDVRERHSAAAAGEIMKRRLELVHRRLYEGGMRSLKLAQLPSLSHDDELRAVIAKPPTVDWRNGYRGRVERRLYRPIASWVARYTKHQGFVDDEAQRAIARIDARVREIAWTLQGQQNAKHAESLAMLRALRAELAELRGRDRSN
jgi:glycosyltransferase involved in cell wall biosynthesis